ncbi:MAG: ion transporter [Pseudomonadota bacterium]
MSENVATDERGFRARLRAFVDSQPFSNMVLAVIIVNVLALVLSLSDTMAEEYGDALSMIQVVTLSLFGAEMVVKLIAYRGDFFRSAWNIFDMVIVIVALIPAAGSISMLRIVRLARALRLVTAYRTAKTIDDPGSEVDVRPDGIRGRLREFFELDATRNFILSVIVLNGIVLGISTSQELNDESIRMIAIMDDIVIVIFVIEIALKLYAYGLRFFTNAWNLFDFVIVAISLLPQSDTLSVLRGMRVIRALRVMSTIPQMREVVKALLDALPGMGAVALLLAMVFYIFGIMATLWFGEAFPEWFGTLGASLYSLFQIMTLESWSMGIVRPVMEQFPWAWAFFVPFIMATAFAVLNLFIGLLVNTMQAAVEEEQDREIERLHEIVQKENAELAKQLSELDAKLETVLANQKSGAKDDG